MSEKEIEDLIFNADTNFLSERGLYLPYFKKRQLKIGNYGIADIVGYEKAYFFNGVKHTENKIYIYELKKETINIDAFIQAVSYAKGIKRYMEKYKPNIDFGFKIILIGKDIDLSNSLVYLPDLFDNEEISISIYTFDYRIDGFYFKEHSGYSLKDEKFDLDDF